MLFLQKKYLSLLEKSPQKVNVGRIRASASQISALSQQKFIHRLRVYIKMHGSLAAGALRVPSQVKPLYEYYYFLGFKLFKQRRVRVYL